MNFKLSIKDAIYIRWFDWLGKPILTDEESKEPCYVATITDDSIWDIVDTVKNNESVNFVNFQRGSYYGFPIYNERYYHDKESMANKVFHTEHPYVSLETKLYWEREHKDSIMFEVTCENYSFKMLWALKKEINLFSADEKDVLCAINAGCNINSTNVNSGYTPLHYAVLYNNINAIKSLLEAGAKINKTDKNHNTAIYEAVKCENFEAIKILLQYNPDLEIGSGCNSKTPLMEACEKGNLDIIELLLLHNADVNKKDADGKTSHDYADLSDKPDEVKSLLKKYQ